VKATRSPNADGLLVYIEPGEGKAEQFEAIVFDANSQQEITRETIIPQEGRNEDDIRHTIKANLETGQEIEVKVMAMSHGKISESVSTNLIIEKLPEEEIELMNIGKTTVDILRPDFPNLNPDKWILRVKNKDGNEAFAPDELDPNNRLHTVENLLHNEEYIIEVVAYDQQGKIIKTFKTEIIKTEALEIKDIHIESVEDVSARITWKPETSAKSYKITLTEIGNTGATSSLDVQNINDVWYFDVPYLKPGTKYSVTMTPYDELGRAGLVSGGTDTGDASILFVTKPARPTELNVIGIENLSSEFITLKFNGVAAVSYYEIEIYPGDADIENPVGKINDNDIIPSNDNGIYQRDFPKSMFEFDRDYQFLIYSVLNADNEQLRSKPQRKIFNMPRESNTPYHYYNVIKYNYYFITLYLHVVQ
jgi:hypothetical protein